MNRIDPAVLTETAKEAVLYANTPSYLLEKLRKDPAIQILRHANSPENLWGELKEAPPVTSALDMVGKYLFVVAVATSEWPEKWAALSSLNLRDLEWGETLWKLIQAENVPTATVHAVIDSKGPATFSWNQPELIAR